MKNAALCELAGFIFKEWSKFKEELDETVEDWLRDTYDVYIDFEIDDALAKLLRLGIVLHDNDWYAAQPLTRSNDVLVQHWDTVFD